MVEYNMVELYTQVKILSSIEINDSISDIQQKTSLSFVTTQKAINNLEKKQLIKTEKRINKKGKSRECTWFSIEHHVLCKYLISVLDRLNLYLNNEISFIEPDVKEYIKKLQKVKVRSTSKNTQSTLEIYS
ncbi:MAG: hypothetical protein WA102_08600 [Candidatus Methanoperedens sp.]